VSVVSFFLKDAFYHDSYAAHRDQFLDECASARGLNEWIAHPLAGPEGEPLTVDIARFGPTDASRLLMVISGTHGIEGFCGSAIQASVLKARVDRTLPPGVALVLVHALNPYGFAWRRRTDAENIDLNRNFRNFDEPAPANAAYEEVHAALVPADWSGPARGAADAWLQSYVKDRGMRTLQAAVFGGQYQHPDGLVYGGCRPAWSNNVWHQILATHAARAEFVAVLDIHSGLGEPGACELISGAPSGSREHRAARAWFGPSIVFPGANSTAPAASGYMSNSLSRAIPNSVASLVVAEFGTVAIDEIFSVLRADNWIHAHEQPESALWQRVKADMFNAFVRLDPTWKAAIVDQGMNLVERLLLALRDARAEDFAL
jgi:hypothetical protein